MIVGLSDALIAKGIAIILDFNAGMILEKSFAVSRNRQFFMDFSISPLMEAWAF